MLPEIPLHLATEVTPLWEATESTLAAINLPPPYWAFAWPGGRAVARHVLDVPELVAGKRVLDFAAGSGMIAIAAAKAGAAEVLAAEIDDFAADVIGLNAEANGVAVRTVCEDIVGRPLPGIDVVLAGDVCYEKPMAERVIGWLRGLAREGVLVIIGDPGRAYVPKTGLRRWRSSPCRPRWIWRTGRSGIRWSGGCWAISTRSGYDGTRKCPDFPFRHAKT